MKRVPAAVLIVALLFLATVWCYLCVYRARPYWVTEIDLEQDYLYNAKLIRRGSPVAGIHHPGTPIYLLGALLLGVVGDDLTKTQQFFDASYFVIFLSSVAAVAFFAMTALRASPPGLVLLSLAVLLAWPPFLFHLNYFGADAFVVPVGLPTATLFWRALEREATSDRSPVVLCGLGLGLCLAVKMSFLPFVVAVMAGWAVHAVRSLRAASRSAGASTGLWFVAAMPVSAAVSYLLLTLPIVWRLPRVWLGMLGRSDIHPAGGHFWSSLAVVLDLVIRVNPLLGLVWFGIFAATVWTLWRGLRQRGAREGRRGQGGVSSGRLDRAAAGAFVALGLAGLLYTVSVAAGDWAPQIGSRLRNASPSALVLLFAILYCARRSEHGTSVFRGAPGQVFLALVGILTLAWGLVRDLGARDVLIREHVARAGATRLRLEQLASHPGRVAFWTRYLDHLGEAGFHFWGNYRYAFSQFDETLLRHFPRYTLLRLRDVGHGLSDPLHQNAPLGPSRFGRLGDEAWKLRKWLTAAPDPYPKARSLVTGEGAGVQVVLAAFPEDEVEELRGVGEAGLRRELEERWGPAEASSERIAGTRWRLIAMGTDGGTR